MNDGVDGPKDDRTVARRFRVAGSVHLGLAGLINTLTGGILLYLGTTERLVRLAFAELETYVSKQLLVEQGDTIVALATTGAIFVGVALVLIGLATLSVVGPSLDGRRPSYWGAAIVGSLLNPLAAPLAGLAFILLWIDGRLEVDGPLRERLAS